MAAITPARERALDMRRPAVAVEARARRDAGRSTRNMASAPIHRPMGTNRVAIAEPGPVTVLSVETVSVTGSEATAAASDETPSPEGSFDAPSARPVDR